MHQPQLTITDKILLSLDQPRELYKIESEENGPARRFLEDPRGPEVLFCFWIGRQDTGGVGGVGEVDAGQ